MALEEEEIDELAKAPKKVRTDEGLVEERDIDDIVKADQYNSGKGANAVPWGMKVARTKPGGTVT